MSSQEAAILVFFVISAGQKWKKSSAKKKIDEYVQTPLIYKKYEINSYAIIKNRWSLQTVQKYAKRNDIPIYEEFTYLSSEKKERYGYFIEHFHMLSKTHSLPANKIPSNWRGVKKSPYKEIVTKICDENSQIKKYCNQYGIGLDDMRILPIFSDHLALLKLGLKRFEFRTILKCIPIGEKKRIKKIFKHHDVQKPKISLICNQQLKFDSGLKKKQKRKIVKYNWRIKNANFINEFIKQANDRIEHKVTPYQCLKTLKENDELYTYQIDYAHKHWNISRNEFIECKQFKGAQKRFQNLNNRKTTFEVEQLFNEEQARAR